MKNNIKFSLAAFLTAAAMCLCSCGNSGTAVTETTVTAISESEATSEQSLDTETTVSTSETESASESSSEETSLAESESPQLNEEELLSAAKMIHIAANAHITKMLIWGENIDSNFKYEAYKDEFYKDMNLTDEVHHNDNLKVEWTLSPEKDAVISVKVTCNDASAVYPEESPESTPVTESETTVQTSAETTTAVSESKTEYITDFEFDEKTQKQLTAENCLMASNRLDDFIIFYKDEVTEEHIDKFVFSTFGNGEGTWGLDYIETFNLQERSDPLGKFGSGGLCDVFDAKGVDKFLLDVFNYKATHTENYRYVYFYDGKYYKFTGDGGGNETFSLDNIAPTTDGRYLAKFNYTDYMNNYMPVFTLFSVFDDNGRIRFQYDSVTTSEPAVKTKKPSDSNKWYHTVIQQYDTAFSTSGCADFVANDDELYPYVPVAAAYAFENYGSKPEMYFYDIDSNGSEELICAYNIYLYDNGEIHMLFDPDGKDISLGERSTIYIYDNGIVGVHWSGGAFTFVKEYFKINGTKLETIDEIYYDELEDEQNPVWKSEAADVHYPSEKLDEFTAFYGTAIDLTPYRVN